MSTRWTQQELSAYRNEGDPEVDALVKRLLPKNGSESVGTFGYNHMLLLADQMLKTPELAFAPDSKLNSQLKDLPKDLVTYFDPMVAPDWVDAEKLKMGTKLWKENTLLTLGVLYSASLPSCYLMKNGIPALYKSEKLREQQYIFQRIYETGVMLASSMDPNGLSVLNDIQFDDDKLLLEALRNLDADGCWDQNGRTCEKTADGHASELDPKLVHEEIERLRGKSTRYLWGKGYISAKKVRFLHASMRYLLEQNNQCCPFGGQGKAATFSEALSQTENNAWDFEKFGCPVNQEDLAYTLLTFGLVIPRGLAHWGVPVSEKQRDGFLHLWKVIGHVMGIRSELLTDDWQEANELYALIQERQAGHSEAGIALTDALMGFLDEYLPRLPGFAERLSTALIVNQIGKAQASNIIPEERMRATYRFWRRPIYAAVGGTFRMFLRLRGKFYRRFKHLGGITANRIHEAGEHLIESWRSAYIRKPFFVPLNATKWIRQPGVDHDFIEKLNFWRRRLLRTIVISLSFLVITVFSLTAALPAWLIIGEAALTACLGTALITWLLFYGLMNNWLPLVFAKRPVPETD